MVESRRSLFEKTSAHHGILYEDQKGKLKLEFEKTQIVFTRVMMSGGWFSVIDANSGYSQ